MAKQVGKLTISLPRNLILLADQIASEEKTSRSKVVSACLQELANKRLRAQLAEGYKAMARENLRFAKDAMELAHEVLSPWE